MRFVVLFVSAFLLLPVAIAQVFDPDAQQKGFAQLTQSGKLINLLIEPSAKQVRLQVVGKDTAKVKFETTTIEASVGLGKLRKQIKLVKVKDPQTQKEYYVFDRTEEPLENLEIHVKSGPTAEKFTIPHLR